MVRRLNMKLNEFLNIKYPIIQMQEDLALLHQVDLMLRELERKLISVEH